MAVGASAVSVEVAKDFLQTVLIVDDRASLQLRSATESLTFEDTSTDRADADQQKRGQDAGDDTPEAGLVEPTEEDVQVELHGDLDAKTIIDAFARLGLVCGVIRPEAAQTEDLNAVVNPAAMRSDVLVLDWWMHGDAGAASLGIIRELARNSSQQHRIRLIIVYTAVPDLARVARDVKDAIENAELIAVNQVAAGGLRVVVLGKPETPVDSSLHDAIVEFADLPKRVIDEFADVVHGLVSNVALSSLAAVRNSTYRILTRFSRELDPAYLGHRMLLPHPEDAEEHLVAAVISELMAVLDSTNVGSRAGLSSVVSMLDESLLTVNDVGDLSNAASRHNVPLNEMALRLTEFGIDSAGHGLSRSEQKQVRNWISSVYSVPGSSTQNIDEQFAILMNSKLNYGKNPPLLRLGSVVWESQTKSFMLCMQPVCDSVRLSSVTDFPFLPFIPTTAKFDIVVKHGDAYHLLKLLPKMRDLRIVPFKPGGNPPGTVAAEKDSTSGRWWFKPEDEQSHHPLEWVGDIRDSFAHKYANVFADSASRVGVDESEWLRRAT